MNKVMLVLTLVCCFVSPRAGATYFDDGEVHDVASFGMWDSTGYINNNFWDEPTTVNIIGGADTNYGFWVYDTSMLNIRGEINYARAYDNSQINVTWGADINALRAYDNSQVTITGGDVGYFTFIEDYSRVHISGGRINGGLSTSDYSEVDISGGSIEGQITLYGGSTITFHGSNFMLDGKTVFGTIAPTSTGYATLTGMFVDGTSFNHHLRFGSSGTSLVLIPEPTTLSLLGMGLCALHVRRRAKQ